MKRLLAIIGVFSICIAWISEAYGGNGESWIDSAGVRLAITCGHKYYYGLDNKQWRRLPFAAASVLNLHRKIKVPFPRNIYYVSVKGVLSPDNKTFKLFCIGCRSRPDMQ